MEDFMDTVQRSFSDLQRKFYGVAIGTVKSVDDPLSLGRVQISLPFIDDQDESPWARVATPMAGSSAGIYFIPSADDEVLVAFEHGDLNSPYVLGALWSALSPPPLPSPLADVRMIRTTGGNTIMFDEQPATITIKTPNGQTIVLSEDGVKISDNETAVTLTESSVDVTCGDSTITIDSDGVSITASPDFTLSADGDITISAGGTCAITGSLVTIN
jgi:uncharacterized protein involved in type VI secretion and phage assembly